MSVSLLEVHVHAFGATLIEIQHDLYVTRWFFPPVTCVDRDTSAWKVVHNIRFSNILLSLLAGEKHTFMYRISPLTVKYQTIIHILHSMM